MDNRIFARKLNEIVHEINAVPTSRKKRLIILGKETEKYDVHLKKTVEGLQETLDYLKLTIKYLLFDLEATRRENAYLRKLLEETNS